MSKKKNNGFFLSTYCVPGTIIKFGIIEFCSKKMDLTTRYFQQNEVFLKSL